MKILLRDDNGHMRTIADSAVARNGQPWFVPDFGENWRWRQALAFRVSKLGKNVSAGFADRYIDAMTLLWVAEADKCPALDYMDGAVVCGRWMTVDELPQDIVIDMVTVTEYATIKNGDIFAKILPKQAVKIEPDTHISLTLKNQEVLKFNLK